MKLCLIYKTKQEAEESIKIIDNFFGYPKIEKAEIGPDVYTETFAKPIPLKDNTWAVPFVEGFFNIHNLDKTNIKNITAEEINNEERISD